MGFFDNLVNGFKLGNATRKLVFQDKNLLLYPVIMGLLAAIEVIVIFFGGLILIGTAAVLGGNTAAISGGGYALTAIAIILMIICYIASTFTVTYLTIAMLIAFRSYMNGKKISLGDAISQTRPYLTLAFEWAVFYSIVILILNGIESRIRGIGRIVLGVVGSLAITVAIMFAIPAIIDNKVGPIKAVEISAKTLVSHFGQTFGGIVFTDLFSLIIIVLGILVAAAGIFAGAVNIGLAIILVGVGIIIIAFGAILGFTLSNVFRFILYEYINGKELPKGIDEQLIKGSIKQKRQSAAVL